jgi:hypothetical protein
MDTERIAAVIHSWKNMPAMSLRSFLSIFLFTARQNGKKV